MSWFSVCSRREALQPMSDVSDSEPSDSESIEGKRSPDRPVAMHTRSGALANGVTPQAQAADGQRVEAATGALSPVHAKMLAVAREEMRQQIAEDVVPTPKDRWTAYFLFKLMWPSEFPGRDRREVPAKLGAGVALQVLAEAVDDGRLRLDDVKRFIRTMNDEGRAAVVSATPFVSTVTVMALKEAAETALNEEDSIRTYNQALDDWQRLHDFKKNVPYYKNSLYAGTRKWAEHAVSEVRRSAPAFQKVQQLQSEYGHYPKLIEPSIESFHEGLRELPLGEMFTSELEEMVKYLPMLNVPADILERFRVALQVPQSTQKYGVIVQAFDACAADLPRTVVPEYCGNRAGAQRQKRAAAVRGLESVVQLAAYVRQVDSLRAHGENAPPLTVRDRHALLDAIKAIPAERLEQDQLQEMLVALRTLNPVVDVGAVPESFQMALDAGRWYTPSKPGAFH